MDEKFNGPQNLKEFEDRLSEFLYYLHDRFFGYAYEVVSTKMLKRDKSDEILVDVLCGFEKYCREKKDEIYAREKLAVYGFLKLALERDAPFDSEYHLGVGRDRSGLTSPQKNKIAIQAAAQVLWNLEKNNIPTIKEMKEKLKNKENPIHMIFQINRFNSRTIENWVSKIFPVPKDSRKGHPLKEGVPEELFKNLIPIPGIFLEDGNMINFPKLRFAIICLTRVLITLGWSIDQIEKSSFVKLYQSPLKFYPHMYVNDWIKDAAVENSSIFDP